MPKNNKKKWQPPKKQVSMVAMTREDAMLSRVELRYPGGLEPYNCKTSAFKPPSHVQIKIWPGGIPLTEQATILPVPTTITSNYMRMLIDHVGSEQKAYAMFRKTTASLCRNFQGFPISKFVSHIFPEFQSSIYEADSFPLERVLEMRKRVVTFLHHELFDSLLNKPQKPTMVICDKLSPEEKGCRRMSTKVWTSSSSKFQSPYIDHWPKSLRRRFQPEPIPDKHVKPDYCNCHMPQSKSPGAVPAKKKTIRDMIAEMKFKKGASSPESTLMEPKKKNKKQRRKAQQKQIENCEEFVSTEATTPPATEPEGDTALSEMENLMELMCSHDEKRHEETSMPRLTTRSIRFNPRFSPAINETEFSKDAGDDDDEDDDVVYLGATINARRFPSPRLG